MSFQTTPVSWRSGQTGQNQLLTHSAYDPLHSFAYTSAYSGRAPGSRLTSSAEGIQDRVLGSDLVQENLADLGRTADGTKLSYLSLTLSGYSLCEVGILCQYPHIQRLNLASNDLTDLSVLGNLPDLVYLDVSYNKLTSILDFQPPPRNLLEANYSHNDIEVIGDLSHHTSLTKLILDRNHITEIAGLSELECLAHLSLADNRLEQIAGIQHLPIKFLRLSGNNIRRIENLETLEYLQVLDLSSNNITSLKGLEGHAYLVDINMEENKVVDMQEVTHLKDLKALASLNLANNPIENLMDYRPMVVFHLPMLVTLDGQTVDTKDKVSARNRFSPSIEVLAAEDHRTSITGSVHKPARLRFSTLTQLDEPYPMLVLCGPPGSGKGYFCKLLVEEFPNFFGLGVSHTTRSQRGKENHGRDYYYIDSSTFNKALLAGEFVETVKLGEDQYGLTMAAIEQVAQQGLASITHMHLQGVLTLKTTHFEPRYVLALPLNSKIHEQRMKAKGCYSDGEIKKALSDVEMYMDWHLKRPGFFDMAINTDSLREGYGQLRNLVMAYGDISPESPQSLSSSSDHTPSSSATPTTGHPTPHLPHTPGSTHSPSLLELNNGTTLASKQAIYAALQHETLEQIGNAAKNWSHTRSSSQASHHRSYSTPVGGSSRPISGVKGNEYGSRQQRLIQAVLEGKNVSIYSDTSRPGTSMSKMEHPYSKTHLGGKPIQSGDEESSLNEDHVVSETTISRLSSERGMSPVNEGLHASSSERMSSDEDHYS